MSLIRKKLSPKLLAAVRSNGRKSRGPRTESGKRHSSLNALQHGAFAQVSPAHMKALGENFSDFAELLASLRQAFNPQDGFEELLIVGIAQLYWRVLRAHRGEAGFLASRKRSFQLDREWNAHLANRAREGASGRTAIVSGGHINSPDCPAKFSEILGILNTVRQNYLLDGLSGYQPGAFELIFGRSCLANDLISSLEVCSRDFDKQSPETQAYRKQYFLDALDVQIKYFERQFELYRRRELEVPQEMSDAQLLPPTEDLDRIIRCEGFLERQIERKLLQLYEWRREKATVILARPLEIPTKAGDAYAEQIERNTTRLLQGKNAKRNAGGSGQERQTRPGPVSPEPRQAHERRR